MKVAGAFFFCGVKGKRCGLFWTGLGWCEELTGYWKRVGD